MSNDAIGLISLIGGLLGFVIKKYAVRFRVKMYKILKRTSDQRKIDEAEKFYGMGIIIFSSFLILFGIWMMII